MAKKLRDIKAVKRLRKTMAYARLRLRLPMREAAYVDDRDRIGDAEVVRIDWPAGRPKPRVGLVRDLEKFPRWTKYARFLETNGFPFEFFDIHAHDWIVKARGLDAVVGMVSNEINQLEEIRVKYHFLETVLGKTCYPTAAQAMLYENKCLEAFMAEAYGFPIAKTHISQSREDALAMLDGVRYPLVSKINHSSGSMGVELVRAPRKARRIIRQAFSRNGRSIHVPWFRQKNYVYFQEFVPNDGYDIRVIVIGPRAFGYYRAVPAGDFRASGMNIVEKRGLPEEALRIAWSANRRLASPQLVVDMVHGLDGRFAIVEYSYFYQVETPEQLKVDGVPGAYILDDDGRIAFEPGRYWVHELALREFLAGAFLSKRPDAPA